MGVGSRPFHRDQGGAAPLAADAEPLDKADDGQDDGAPDADRRVARDETDGEGREAGQQQGCDQRHLAADAVAEMAEQRRADRAGDKADGVDAERLQGPGERFR